jgi:hypothetical protein
MHVVYTRVYIKGERERERVSEIRHVELSCSTRVRCTRPVKWKILQCGNYIRFFDPLFCDRADKRQLNWLETTSGHQVWEIIFKLPNPINHRPQAGFFYGFMSKLRGVKAERVILVMI